MTFDAATLRAHLEPFLRDRADLELARVRGVPTPEGYGALHARYPELSRPESFHALREALEGRADAPERDRLRALWRFVADQVQDALAAPAQDEIDAAELKARPAEDLPDVGLADALALLARERSRERRVILQRAIDHHLATHTAPYARRAEAPGRAAERLGFEGPLALRRTVLGRDDDKDAAHAEALVAQTGDAYRDLLGYALKRIDPTLRALPSGDAQRHDLWRATGAPWLASHLGRAELLDAYRRTLGDLQLPPGGPKALELDTEDASGRWPHVVVAPRRVPGPVRLALRLGPGVRDALDLGYAHGAALRFACAGERAPVEDRWLGDPALADAVGRLFATLLLDEGWLRRHLRAPNSPARELARVAAFADLARLREACAALRYELLLHRRGAERELADAYAELRRKALWVDVPPGAYLRDVSPRLAVADELRGWALAARLRVHLLERYNEDWWRNPGAGRFLRETLSRGAGDEAMALLATVAGGEPRLEDAGVQRVQVMGA